MPRSSSGTYTLPSGNPVSSGTLIEASWANTTLSDLASAMTDSLSRDGEGGMTAALRLYDGDVSLPGLAFSNETTSGLYRAGAGDLRLSVTGAQVIQFLSTGVSVAGTLSSTGNFAVNTDRFTVAASSGNTAIAGTLGVTGAIAATGGVTGNLTGNVTGDVSGNAGTVTNGVYTTGDQTIGGVKRFSSSMAVGGSGTPATNLDVQTTGANALSSLFTTGLSDLNFRIGFMNGVAGSSGASQGKAGLFYLGSGEVATIDFRRGAGATDGSFAFRTSGNDRATLDNSGNFTATGNITAYSDERLKKDWSELPVDFVDRLALAKHGTYTRIDTGDRQAGASAQDFQRLLPEVVSEGEHMSLAYGNAALVAAIQLARRVVRLEHRVACLEK